MKPVHKIKDNAYKLIFGEPEMFIEFLNSFIPIDILQHIKPSDIEDITERFLPLFSDNKDSDTVKRIRLSDNEPLFVISIIEHESEVNYTSSFKMLQYITYVLSDYVKENDKKHKEELDAGYTKLKPSYSKDFKLPPVLPIVFYDGSTKWTSSLNLLDRTEMSDIFYKYVPKFEYELVDLNEYSREGLLKFGNLLSLILIVDKVRRAEDLELLNTLPEDYLDKLKLNVPEHLLKLLADCMRMFLIKADVAEEKIDSITEKLYQRRFVDMFDVQFSFKEIEKEIEKKIEKEIEKKIEKKIEKEATRKSAIEIAKKLLGKGLSIKDISESTGLDEELIEHLVVSVNENAVLS